LEFFEESLVILGEEAQVVDTVFQVGDALHAHAEGIAGVDIRVDAAGSEVVRVDHAAAEDLYPSRVFAEVAALSAADVARDIHLSTRLGEGEVRRAQADLRVGPKHLAGEGQQHLLEVGEAHALVDIESFNLMEEAVGACRDGLVAVDTSRAEHADRRLVSFHIMRLIAGGMRAQHHVLGHVALVLRDKEGILHVACGMVSGKIQHGEHVLVVVDLGTVVEREAHALEDVDDLILDNGQGMTGAQGDRVGRACQVLVVVAGIGKGDLLAQRVDLVLSDFFQLVDLDAYGFFLVCGHVTEVCHDGIDLTFLAQVLESELLDVVCVLSRELRYFF